MGELGVEQRHDVTPGARTFTKVYLKSVWFCSGKKSSFERAPTAGKSSIAPLLAGT